MRHVLKNLAALFLAMLITLATSGCDILGLTSEEDDNSTTFLAAAALLLSSSSSCSGGAATTTTTITNLTATLSGGCVNGVVTSMDSNLPDWIKNNFTCVVAWVSTDGLFYCFKSTNLPNHASYYWAGKLNEGSSGSYPLFEALPVNVVHGGTIGTVTHTNAGTNQIAQQNMVYSIPVTPTPDTDGTLTGTQAGYASIGLTRNGISIFNNAAAPGDTLSNEVSTFDKFGAHPETTGNMHHHAYVFQYSTDKTFLDITAGANDDANLIGIALDGYAIYGKRCIGNVTATGLDSLHGHTTTTADFSTATYHYHYVNDVTAGNIDTLMGSYFYGNPGSISN